MAFSFLLFKIRAEREVRIVVWRCLCKLDIDGGEFDLVK